MGYDAMNDFLEEMKQPTLILKSPALIKHPRPKKAKTPPCCIHIGKAGITCPTCWLSFCDDCMIVHNKIACTHVPVDVMPTSIYPTLPDCFPFRQPGTAIHPTDMQI